MVIWRNLDANLAAKLLRVLAARIGAPGPAKPATPKASTGKGA